MLIDEQDAGKRGVTPTTMEIAEEPSRGNTEVTTSDDAKQNTTIVTTDEANRNTTTSRGEPLVNYLDYQRT